MGGIIHLRVHPEGKTFWSFDAVMPASSVWHVATLVMGLEPTKEPSAQPERDQMSRPVMMAWRGEMLLEGALRAAAKRVVRVTMVYCILKVGVEGALGS